MMKRLLRTWVGTGCRATALLARNERRTQHGLTVLCYHRILPEANKQSYFYRDAVVTPESFRHQCITLKRYYEVLPLHEAVEVLSTRRASDRPIATITFDDGYQDNYCYAQPILASLELRATFFVIAGLVGTDEAPWYDRLARAAHTLQQQDLERIVRDTAGPIADKERVNQNHNEASTCRLLVELAKAMSPRERKRLLARLSGSTPDQTPVPATDLIMDWGQLVALGEAGHEIGSHGLTHELLTLLDDLALETEVVESRRLLEEKTGQPVRSFCYPNGDVDDRVARVVTSAGYQNAVTTEVGLNEPTTDRLRLRRRFIHEGRLTGFAHRPSATLLRMELCGLSSRLFRRHEPGPHQI